MSGPRGIFSAAILAISLAWVAASEARVSAIRTTPEARARYLAHAMIWRDPEPLSPTDLLEGPAAAFPYTFDRAAADAQVACTFARPGKELGGNTEKFLCRTADGQDLRLKYWDPQSRKGNREVFATVATSRLMWALGFNAVPAVGFEVRCEECPENPHEGTGSRRTHRYLAMLQALWQAPVILSSDNTDQGWSWLELDTAIRSLAAGPERARQRMYFDALTLLGVFVQHGDRKGEQQRLYCAAPVDVAAGDVRGAAAATRLTLLERPDASACQAAAVTIADVGATFGGAGRSSNAVTAKMNLDAWRRKHVFTQATGECRGSLTVSLRARHDGEGNPVISEEGRRFLLERLQRLTPDHVRAIFRAAHVDELYPQEAARSPEGAGGVDAWVAAFQDKVRQIDVRRCQPGT
jgi:hypothetical protein